MRVFAAIDVREGAVVQLVGGDPSAERVRLADPAAVARRWLVAGFARLHVVDLDAALGSGGNEDAIEAIAREAAGRALLQVGGGVRDGEAIRRLLDLGAARVVVGTRAVEEPDWLASQAPAYPGRLVVAADIRDGVVLSRGWTRSTGTPADGLLEGLDPLPLAAVLVTDVAREGRQSGVDAGAFRSLATATRHPLIAAGGIAGVDDLRALREAGASGAVLGMSLYTGRIDPARALEMEDP